MGFAFNPFTGNFDLKGSGGGASYIDGEVATYADLPLDGTAAINTAWLVRTASGVWPVTRKQAGIYIRTATGGSNRDSDYTYAGTLPDVFSDSQFLLYDNSDSSRNLAFDLGSITTGQTRTLTVPDASATIAISATRTAATYSTDQLLPATRNTQLVVGNSSAGSINLDLPVTNTNDGDIYTFIGGTVVGPIVIRRRVLLSPEIWTEQARITAEGQNHTFRATGSGNNNWELISANWAKPNAIGSTTPAAGTFTTLTASSGTITASAPVLDLAQTWNASGTTFTALRVNVTNTASASASNLIDIQLGGTTRMMLKRDGVLHLGQFTNSGFYSPAPSWHGSTSGLLAAGNLAIGSSLDTILERGGAGIIEQRNAANAQEFRVYGTYTSATNYQRLTIKTKAVTLSALSGASVATTTGLIPDGAVLVGLTTRVSTAITGATGYDIGDGSDADRWGANVAIALNTSSDNRDWTAGTIECFTAAQEVTLTAVGSNFTGGAVVIVAHYLAGEAD
jgi:hypothetical protein